MKIVLKNFDGEEVYMSVLPTDTFQDLKRRISHSEGIDIDLNDLIIDGRPVLDHLNVIQYFEQKSSVEEKTERNILSCCVPGCSSLQSDTEKLFFEFPSESRRLVDWATTLEREDLVLLSPDKLKNFLVCSDHFLDEHFLQDGTLLETACPCPYSSLKLEDHDRSVEQEMYCRLCGLKLLCSKMINIFDNEIELSTTINACLPLSIKSDDVLSKYVCYDCLERLNTWQEFVELCFATEKKLLELHFRQEELKQPSLQPQTFVQELVEEPTKGLPDTWSPGEALMPQLEPTAPSTSDCHICTKTTLLEAEEFVSCLRKHMKHCLNKDDNERLNEMREKQKEVLKQHNYAHRPSPEPIPERGVFCLFCQDTIMIEQCEEHKNVHFDETSSLYPCFICYETFRYSCELSEHFTSHECKGCGSFMRNRESHVCIPLADDTSDICRICNDKVKDVAAHMQLHTSINNYPCIQCTNVFDSEDKLLEHCQIHKSPRKSFRCELCKKTYRCEYRYQVHEMFHGACGSVKCTYCSKCCSTELRLYKHVMYNHVNKQNFTCEACNKLFHNKSSLTYHMRSHLSLEAMKPYTCDICKKRFARKNILRDHMMNRHGAGIDPRPVTCFQCRICKECYPNTTSAISHMELHHKNEVSEEVGYSFDMLAVHKLFCCEFCRKTYSASNYLIEHRMWHTTFICLICHIEFSSHDELSKHYESHDVVEFNVPRLFLCEYCEKCFKNYDTYSTHRSQHLDDNPLHPYQCQYCSQVFPTFETVSEHKLSHSASEKNQNRIPDCLKPFECSHCDKAFTNLSALTKHVRVHTGERPFACDICNKRFTQSSGLYTHRKVHSDHRPYKCDLCERSFKIIGDYKLHIRKHTGLRPYKCDFCEKSFMTQQTYSQHRKLHTEVNSFFCNVCNESFRRAHTLKKHQLRHKRAVLHCPLCARCFQHKSGFVKHVKKHHPEQHSYS